ncbi:MAG: NAD(P)/FAD-dependent oxidoreductase [Planctomycetaceae bacterium]
MSVAFVDQPVSTKPPSGSAARWLVVGGGMMGLKVARDLVAKGQRVTVCEAAPQMGGLTSAWKLGDVVWDRFYHVTLLSDTKLRELLAEIGLEKEIRWVETKTGFFSEGELISMSNTAEFLRFPPLNLIQKLRLGGTIFYASKIRNWRRLEKITVEKWLRRWSGNAVFQKVWQPLLKAKLGEAYHDSSAAFIWAHTARMYKARRSGMKTEMFGYVPGGYARILDTLQQHLTRQGVEFWPAHPVAKIQRGDSNGLKVSFANGKSETFDNVVMTVPSPLIAKTCETILQKDECQRLADVRYLGVVCASLLLKKPISPYYVTNIIDAWVPLTAVIEMSTIVNPQEELAGHHLVYLPKYLPDDHPGHQVSDDEYQELCLSTLEKMYPHFSRADVIDFKVSRARYVAALQTIRYSERLPPIVTSVPGLYALNSAHILKGNLNVNETIDLGEEKMSQEVWPDACRRSKR